MAKKTERDLNDLDAEIARLEAELADLEKGGEKKLKDADAASASSEESGRKSAFGLSIPRRDRKDANAGRVAPNDAAQKPADERSIS